MARLFSFCLCLFDAIDKLHAMNEKKCSMTFSLDNEHVVETTITSI